MNKQQILDSMVHACLTGDTKSFLPALNSANVGITMPDKRHFFNFFENMIKTKKDLSIGNWTLKVEKTISDEFNFENPRVYNFYDEYHKYPVLQITVSEKDGKIFLDTNPF